jgi:hypothetical protein
MYPAQQAYPSIPHEPPPVVQQAYPPSMGGAFPAFPDAPTQVPVPSVEPVVAEQPKEALLIEL